jgi:5-methylcytosine-specific restriction endonuclease McrA
METQTLLLNSWGMPHRVLNWYDAICLVYQEKVNVMEEYDETVSSPSVTYFIPAVLQLKKAVASVKKGVKFSRINVFTRDGFKCQYCGTRKPMRELNYDHVLPRKQGGTTTWDNIVTCCYACNEKKGSRTPEQAGMKLLRKPARPHSLPLHAVFIDCNKIPPAWEPYLDLARTHPHEGGVYLMSSSATSAA